MKLVIKQSYIPEVIEFIFNISLKGKQSRHRTRFIKLLQEKWKLVCEEEVILLKEYADLDESGQPQKKENGDFIVKDVNGFKKQQNLLLDEHFIINGEDYNGMLTTLKEIVFSFDEEVSGKKAMVFDYLCEAFENVDQGNEA
ncbi:hypothetical protein [Cytobacillus purgationiresistens]|uniref:DUF1617 family protein n=1 Tax=Cytobacillus purgationiresistens TaxID=863449 RepID=A0ABU0ACN4_9BACI|nr:hypothetical protein [Cytobacillus purgationiresistens]MDQ0269008.1 hypothetical protein [Cytobacillus purgationiresistens]